MQHSAVQRLQDRHAKVEAVMDKIFQLVLAYALLATVLIVVWQIISRNLSVKNTWTEEASRWLFVWACFLGAAYFAFKNDQIIVDLVKEIRVLRIGAEKLEVLFKVVYLAFYVLIAIGGILYVKDYGGRTSPGLRVPYRVLYYSCPVSFVLMSLFGVYDLVYTIELKLARRKEGVE